MHKIELATLHEDFKDSKVKDEIIQRLREGDSTFSVAVWMQQSLLIYTEVTPHQLSNVLRDFYIENVPLSERVGIANNRSAAQKVADRMRRQTSALEEMEFLYLVQRGRLELVVEEEMKRRDERFTEKSDSEFESEIDTLFDELEADEDGEVATKGKGKGKAAYKRKKKNDDADNILIGVGDNVVETARRLLVDIHKIKQDLKMDPRQTLVDVEIGPALSPEFPAKRGVAVKDALRKFEEARKQEAKTIEVEP